MIEQLTFHNLRGIRAGRLDKLGQINLLVGPNNSGKSTVLEALYLMGVSGREATLVIENKLPGDQEDAHGLPLPVWTPNRYDLLGEAPLPRLWQRHGEPGRWSRKFNIVSNAEENVLRLHLPFLLPADPLQEFSVYFGDGLRKRDDPQTTALCTWKIAEDGSTQPLPGWLRFYWEDETIFSQSPAQHFSLFWYPDFAYKAASVAAWAARGQLPVPENVLFFDLHTATQHFHKRFFRRLQKLGKTRPWKKPLAQRFARVFDLPSDIVVTLEEQPDFPGRMQGIVETDVNIAIDHYGDGARHAFKVLAGLIALAESVDEAHPGLFLWEDPELFMHPATLGRLLKEVMALIQGKPIQVFMSTQSLEILAWIGEMLQDGSLEDEAVHTYVLSIPATGELQCRLFWGAGLNDWLEPGFDPRGGTQARFDLLPFTWRLKMSKAIEGNRA